MPSSIRAPVLLVDESAITNFDPQNPVDLAALYSGMFTP